MTNRLLISIIMLLSSNAFAEVPNVPTEYKKYFEKYSTERSVYSEKVAPLFGGAKAGRSFALVAGVWKYKFGDLVPAKVDIDNLVKYLITEEHFDEVVVLRNEAVSYDNLEYFLQTYFKKRVQSYPQSRFLFTYSGHGNLDGEDGYLVQSKAKSLRDMDNSIGVDILRPLIKRVMDKTHHTLVLLNACHAGSFLSYSYGNKQYLPRKRGAHAITAGGTNELTYSLPSVGPGSVFFEVFLDGVRGAADSIPVNGDGIVTFNELFGYIHNQTTQVISSQIPRQGDLRPGKDTSEGSFFFIDKDVDISEPSMFEKLVDAIPFGKKATIKHLFAEPTVVVQGSGTKLSWGSENTNECQFSDNDVVYKSSGTRQVSPLSTFEYQLTCKNDSESASKTFTVSVLPPPVIEEFDASSTSIVVGESTSLSWTVKNAKTCSIDNGIGVVPIKSSYSVAPKVTKRFTLHCSTQNVKKTASLTINVSNPVPVCSNNEVLEGGTCVSKCDQDEKWDGRRCISRCDDHEEWNGRQCVDRCEDHEKWDGRRCRDRCSEDKEWNGRRCESRCSRDEEWDGYECVTKGLRSGAMVRPCGCWGFVNFGARDREPQCASGVGVAVGCQAYCPGGGYQWGVRCQ